MSRYRLVFSYFYKVRPGCAWYIFPDEIFAIQKIVSNTRRPVFCTIIPPISRESCNLCHFASFKKALKIQNVSWFYTNYDLCIMNSWIMIQMKCPSFRYIKSFESFSYERNFLDNTQPRLWICQVRRKWCLRVTCNAKSWQASVNKCKFLLAYLYFEGLEARAFTTHKQPFIHKNIVKNFQVFLRC